MRIVVALVLWLSGALPTWAQTVSLEAPATIPAGAPFEVTWQGGAIASDLITITRADGSKLPAAAYAYVNKRRKVTLTAPAVPGSYAIAYRQDRAALASIPLQVTPVTASLQAPAAVELRETFEVAWQGPGYRLDQVRIAKADGSTLLGGSYVYLNSAKGGPAKLIAPEKPGSYALQYVMHGQILAQIPLSVGATTASVKAVAEAQAGADLDVVWTGPGNQGDRITLALAGADRPLTGSSYVYAANSIGNAVTLTLPEELGQYEVVYITGRTILARAPVTVKSVEASLSAAAKVPGNLGFEVAWDGPGNRQDLIALVDPALDQAFLSYAYVDPFERRVTLTAPVQPGQYELRYRTGAGKVLAARTIKVTAPAAEPGVLIVTRDAAKGLGAGAGVEVILDASGSMLQRQGGTRRIDIAKATLVDFITNTIPKGTGFALRVFGHKEADSCRTDLEMPLAPLDAVLARARIEAIEAQNLAKTPIAASLAQVAEDLKEATAERVVVLVTDGEETCEGDPAVAIRALRATGWDVRVNIVGYAVDDKGLRQTFESWAALGAGRYLDASDPDELADAIRRAVAVPYDVIGSADGTVLARGRANGRQIELPPGSYQVRYVLGGRKRLITATVAAGRRTEVELP